MNALREARVAKGDMRMREKSIAVHTREQLDAIKEILDTDNPIGIRTCCYHLLSLGLLNSTKDFSNMAKKINDARKRHEDDRDYLPDEGFADASRVLEWNQGWSGGINSYIRAYTRVYERNHWENQKIVPIILCEKTGHGDFLRATTKAEQVRMFLSKGTHARSHLVKLAKHCANIIRTGQEVSIGYLGDFDPSGLRMETTGEHGNNKIGTGHAEGLRDILQKKYDITEGVSWKRLALTEEQFLALPKKARVPVKIEHWDEELGRMVKGDANAPAYIAKYGKLGGEVEALGFATLQKIVKDFIDETRGPKGNKLWKRSNQQEHDEKIGASERFDFDLEEDEEE